MRSGRPASALIVLLFGASVACSQADGRGGGSGGNQPATGTGGAGQVPDSGSNDGGPNDGAGSGGSAQTGGLSGSGPGQTGGVRGSGGVGSGGSGGADATGGAGGSGGVNASGGVVGQGTGGGTGGRTTGSGGTASSGGTTGSGGTQTGSGGHGGAGGRAATGGSPGAGGQGGHRSISFGTYLDASAVIASAQQLAKSAATPSGSSWQAKGDQHRTYRFADASTDEPYRLYVPTNWDGKSQLPLVMFLHGAGNDENSYLDQNGKQMVNLAQQHGFILVSPLGYTGAYGNFLRLSAPFGDEADAAMLMAQVTADTERTNELSEEDVINVLELVLNEYPVDRASVFLTGHSMGSGGTWYIGGKYAQYWRALAPMSGPFVQQSGYPWDAVRALSLFVTEGTQAPSLSASHLLRDWLTTNGFTSKYEEVNADHPGMVKLVLPDVFDFFTTSATH